MIEIDELLHKDAWIAHKDEELQSYIRRRNLQLRHLFGAFKRKGYCYLIKFGESDYRPMWEDTINVEQLKKEVLNPAGGSFDCPLCQPYDSFNQLTDIEKSRRFLCKVVSPQYEEGCVEDGGTWSKCPCLDGPKKRNNHKFRKTL